jgi:hypothetical protein
LGLVARVFRRVKCARAGAEVFATAVEPAPRVRACNISLMKCAKSERSHCNYSCRIHVAERRLMKT